MGSTRDDRFLDVLNTGHCEPLKAAVHGVVLSTAALCALYNGAAWLKRRERHLAVNTILYVAAVAWETCHIRHHLDCIRASNRPAAPPRDQMPDAA
jgi:hypothetical protein